MVSVGLRHRLPVPRALLHTPPPRHPDSPISARMILRLMGWLKPYAGLYTLGAGCGVVSILLELASPEFLRRIADAALPGGDPSQIIRLGMWWGGAMLLSLLFDAVQI